MVANDNISENLFGEEEQSTSILELGSENEMVEVYPNPFTGTINIELNSLVKEMVDILLLDITGRKVISLNEQLKVGENKFSLKEAKSLDSGIYILTVQSDNLDYNTKVVKSSN